jgi:hypothetical protein
MVDRDDEVGGCLLQDFGNALISVLTKPAVPPGGGIVSGVV